MIDFKMIQIFFVVLMAVLGFIATLGGVINMFRNWKKESLITKHEEAITNHEQRLQKLEQGKTEQDEFIHILCKSQLALLKHSINGNSVDALKEAEKELEKFLINK